MPKIQILIIYIHYHNFSLSQLIRSILWLSSVSFLLPNSGQFFESDEQIKKSVDATDKRKHLAIVLSRYEIKIVLFGY